jgi:ABC-type amino acid transport substrate-binding protein
VPEAWSFISREFEAGRLDALANVTITDERRATMDFSIGHACIHGVAYTRPEAPPISRTAQFAGKTMATLRGSIGHTNAVRHGAWGARMVFYPTWAEILRSVRKGECDFALLSRPTVARFYLLVAPRRTAPGRHFLRAFAPPSGNLQSTAHGKIQNTHR